MKKELSLNHREVAHAISQFMHRYHVIIFVLFVIGGLSGATYVLYQTVEGSKSTDTNTPSPAFDIKTIEKIKGLRSANDASTPLVLPPGRTNPFEG